MTVIFTDLAIMILRKVMVADICFQGLFWMQSGMSLTQVLIRITGGIDPGVDLEKGEVDLDLTSDLTVKFYVKIPIYK